jgi:hypothetical protein
MVRDLIVKDFGWKLLALAMAVMIWVIVKGFSDDGGNLTERTFFDLPAQIVSGRADVQNFRINPNVVAVTVKGRPESIKALTEKDIHVLVDVSRAEPAQHSRQRVDVSAPTRITIVKVDPAEVEVVVPPRPANPAPHSKP